MIMEILTGSGGDSVLFARYTGGGFCPRQQKRVGGILSGGDFVLHSYIMLACRNPLGILDTLSSDCSLYKTVNHKHNFRSHDAVCVCL